jgi:hypothetical protein
MRKATVNRGPPCWSVSGYQVEAGRAIDQVHLSAALPILQKSHTQAT